MTHVRDDMETVHRCLTLNTGFLCACIKTKEYRDVLVFSTPGQSVKYTKLHIPEHLSTEKHRSALRTEGTIPSLAPRGWCFSAITIYRGWSLLVRFYPTMTASLCSSIAFCLVWLLFGISFPTPSTVLSRITLHHTRSESALEVPSYLLNIYTIHDHWSGAAVETIPYTQYNITHPIPHPLRHGAGRHFVQEEGSSIPYTAAVRTWYVRIIYSWQEWTLTLEACARLCEPIAFASLFRCVLSKTTMRQWITSLTRTVMFITW